MPKQTFFNLSDEKRKVLMHSVIREFSRVPFAEASIANIVADADISRGSFYQYFEDKEDAFMYLLKEDSDRREIIFVDLLERKNGNLIEAMEEFFLDMLIELNDESKQNLYKNVFTHMNYEIEKTLMNEETNKDDLEERFQKYKSLVNIELLNVSNTNEIFHIFELIMMIIMQNLVFKFAKNLTNEEALQNYKLQINLLSKGILKNERGNENDN